ncbi:AHA1 [Auxenochlorella protothecoides x Auxenochlorella symbiontica]
MAKFGEGDERWLVKDLGQDGRNVNNWHWVERDALPWSKTRLTELLVGQSLVPEDQPAVTITKLKKLEGEAIVNNRKSKIIVAYELEAVLAWEGTAPDGAKVKGELKLPYISEENHDEDPEVLVRLKEESKAGQAVRDLIVKHGRPVVYRAMSQFVSELRAGGPVTKGGSEAASDNGAASAARGAAPAATSAAPAATDAPAASGSGRAPRDRRRIKLTERFYASAQDIYECFTDARRVLAFTQSPAELDARVGGALSMFGGSVQGVFRELTAPSRIVMDWRFSNWAEGDTSCVTIDIEEREKGAVTLHLVQTGIPDCDRFGQHDVVGLTQAGWANQIFHRIRQVFGYGI